MSDLRFSIPVGILPGTVVAARKPQGIIHTWGESSFMLTLHCDDVRWLGFKTHVFLWGTRQRDFARALGALVNDPTSFVGLRGRFVYDFMPYNFAQSSVAWGLRRTSHYLSEYLDNCPADQIESLRHTCGALPADEPHRLGFYR